MQTWDGRPQPAWQMERPGEGEAAAAVLSPSSEGSGSKSIWSTDQLLVFPSSPGLVRLTRLLEVGLGWAQCLESPFGNQNAYDFVHFLQKIYLVHGMARGTLEAHGLRATAG